MKKLIMLVVALTFSTSSLMAQEITDAQFEKFVTAFQSVQQESNNAQAEMVTLIEQEGLTTQRFNEIHQASLNSDKESNATDKEKKQHQAALVKLEEMNKGLQAQMEEKIKAAGLTVEVYQKISEQIKTNPEMQEKLRKRFMGQGQ